jgi:serine/threonine protein kinase/TolB-like protein/Tfp pilus assembly protein PilF
VSSDRDLWQRARPLFEELADLDGDVRRTRLAELTTSDPALRDLLESLVRADPSADDALADYHFGLPLRVGSNSGDASVASSDPLGILGQTVAHFHIISYLASGGMGAVYSADDLRLGRAVALKFPLPYQDTGAVVKERFMHEARAAAALDHPNLCSVYEIGESTVGVFLAMPLYAGETLRDRLAREVRLTPRDAIGIARHVARGLAAAHAAGIVHRDLKPGNVMLVPDGSAKILDFGLAKMLDVSITKSQVTRGTLVYMAPDQLRGGRVDARADLWAVGVMLYVMLTGRLPFGGEHEAAILHAILEDEPEPPSTIVPGLPRAFDDLIGALLQKNPAHRYQSAEELLVDLDALETGAALRHRVPLWTRATQHKRFRRSPVPAGALVAVTLVVLSGSAWAWRSRRDATPDGPSLVAVLPFETVGGAGGVAPDTAFADGLGDAITGKLARLQRLRVIDRASVRSIAEAAARPQAAGRTLGADYVLRATLRWARGADGVPRVQVSPVLVRVVDGTTKWAGEPTVVVPSDPFAAQGTLATAVAEALDVALAPAERAGLARPPTTDTAAFAAVERGRRLWVRAIRGTQQEQVQALREYERAYQRDPQYADALGLAAVVLRQLAQAGAPRALYDSAAVLAHRALALDPRQPDAVFALAVVEMKSRGRPDEATRLIEQAAQAYPSSADLQILLASTRIQVAGDSAGAVDAAARAVALGPRSEEVIFEVIRVMLALRRYDDARDLIARGRALEPESPAMPLMAVELASAVGDTAAVSSAMRELRAAGAGRGVEMLDKMRVGDAALRQEVAAVSLALVGAATARDSILYYRAKVQVFLTRGETARARALMDSGARVSAARAAAYSADSINAASLFRRVAWFAAGRGDRPAAVAALRRGAADPVIRGRPGNVWDADQTCTSAEVYGLLGDAEGMLPFLRRCLTMPNGYHLAQLTEQPAFAHLRADPRVRALVAELAAAQARARSTPVRVAR